MARGLTSAARDAVLEPGDTLLMHPLGVLLARHRPVALFVATFGASHALKGTAPWTVTVRLTVSGLLFGATHVGDPGCGDAAAWRFAVRAHEQPHAARPAATARPVPEPA